MQITINDKKYLIDEQSSISEALELVEGLPKRGIAIALNLDVVPASLWDKKTLNDGDKITIIKAFYGG